MLWLHLILTSNKTNMLKHYMPRKAWCSLLLYTSFGKTIHKTQYSMNCVSTPSSPAVIILHRVWTLRCSKDMMLSGQKVFLTMETNSISCSPGENTVPGAGWLISLSPMQASEQEHLLPLSISQFFLIILIKLGQMRITEL